MLDPLKENIIEIAWLFRDMAEIYDKVEYRDTETKNLICDIADEFEKEYKDTDWNGDDPPIYIEKITDFAANRIANHYGFELI